MKGDCKAPLGQQAGKNCSGGATYELFNAIMRTYLFTSTLHCLGDRIV